MNLTTILNNLIIEQLINEGVFDPAIFKAIFLAGGPGSGKSYVSQIATGGLGYKFVASDKAFEHLLKKAEISLKLHHQMPDEFNITINTHRVRAKDITQKQFQAYSAGRLGLIFDGTGHSYSKIQKLRNDAINMGYDTYMIFVDTSLEIALDRNEKRSRTLPTDIVTQKWETVQGNKNKFKSLFGSNFSLVVNDKPATSFPQVEKDVRRFTKAPIKNPVAKTWIANALNARRRA